MGSPLPRYNASDWHSNVTINNQLLASNDKTNAQNNDIRRASLRRGSLRKGSLRRGSALPQNQAHDLPWDILDRLLLPILCCHAAAIILSGLLNALHISQVSTLALFAWFALSTGGSILFYHHLKVIFISHTEFFFALFIPKFQLFNFFLVREISS